MKYLKVLTIALISVFAFGSAKAQVRVQIGGHPHPVHRRVVVVRHPYHRPYHRHAVVVVHHRY